MKVIDLDQAVRIHQAACPGGLLTDRKDLQGAVYAPHQSFDGVELYPTLVHKAAKYAEAICRVHAFDDGNKRAAWLVCVEFLHANDVRVGYIPPTEVDETMRAVLKHQMDYDDLLIWLDGKIEV